MAKTRVLLVEPHAGLGGAQRVIFDLAERCDRARIEPHLLFLSEGGLATDADALGIPTSCIPIQGEPLSIRRRALLFRRHLRSVRPDVVHIDSVKQLLAMTLAARSQRLPLVWHQQDPLDSNWPSGGTFMARVNRLPPAAVIFGTQIAQTTIQPLIPRVRDFSLITNGVQPPDALMGADEALAEVGLTRAGPIIGMFGRIVEHKQHRLLVEAAPSIMTKHPQVRFVFVGPEDTPTADDLRALALSLGVSERITFTGGVPDDLKWGLFGACGLVVHASRYEPFGLVLVEAMLAHTPVVAARSWGPDWIIDDGRTGLLFDIDDRVGLENAVDRILSSSQLRADLAEAAYAEAMDRFTFERTIRSVEEVWARLTTPSSRSARG